MNSLTLRIRNKSGATMVSNAFIDEYMSDANGEFVKVYLYLLRCVSHNKQLSISVIADKFNHTETDVIRALKYWEKMKLLKLTYTNDILTEITFVDHSNTEESKPVNEEHEVNVVQASVFAAAEISASNTQPEKERKQIPAYSADQIKQFQENSDIKQILFVTEAYLGKTLSVTDINTLLFFYDELHFSLDLIEYLIEYCVSKGSKSMHYIKKTALAWAEEEITTVSQAKASTNLYNKNCNTIFNAFGIKNHRPVEFEVNYINKWTNEYAFTLDIIHSACTRTLKQAHQPSFEYADKILTEWHNKGVKHINDITLLDQEHKKVKACDKPKEVNIGKNKFNNFNQRSYDYQQLEKELLNIK
ncbi:DnaD domain protein [Lachnotalea glycerini]|uniref:DnaD domain protein n=1 Tax=Lachnotalea glycerini TaxID=1763509 RepID=A0A371J6C3_9FIRM|nr:DnaD domain protein [Lachnotalea glycerini]RDY28284.1 DnaD domain protein [Lachnotalea glycerini]